MSDADLGALVIIAFFVIIVLWAIKGPSKRVLEKHRREKEHEVEVLKLELEKEELARRVEEERSVPSGRGKVFKAKRG